MKTLIIFVLLLSLTYSCGNSFTHYLPAVFGEGGELVKVTISSIPGTGNVYVGVYPRTGESTQESIEKAINYAKSLSPKESCDYIVSFNSTVAQSVDGPSGGASMALITYATINNLNISKDFVLTGTISPNGIVGPVGGLYEKAKAAVNNRMSYFLTPKESIFEFLLLKKLAESNNLQIIEVNNFSEVLEFAINKTKPQNQIIAKKRSLPDISSYEFKFPEFSKVANEMIEKEQFTLDQSFTTNLDKQSTQIKEFFVNEISNQKKLVELGYIFSAANEAFSNYIDLETIKLIQSGKKPNFKNKKSEINECIISTNSPTMTDQNFEWVIGADLRKAWAIDKIKNTSNDDGISDEEYYKYHELIYAQAWCNVRTALIKYTPEGGKNIDQNKFKELASEYIASATNVTANEQKQRLNIAKISYESGYYGAAIFDSVYAKTMSQIDRELVSIKDFKQVDNEFITQNYSSLWGNVYKSQGVYLFNQNDYEGAYRILKYAKALEDATNQMKSLIIEEPQKEDQNQYPVVAILGFLLLILIIFAYGSQRKGNRKVYRAK